MTEKIVRQGPRNDERPVPVSYQKSNIILGSDAENEFSAMKREAGKKGVSLNELPPQTVDEIRQRAIRGQVSGGVSSATMFNSFFSPFRTRQSIEEPTKRQDINQWYRYWIKYDPLVGTAIQFHSEFPLSDFELDHPDPTVRDFFNDQKEKLNLPELCMWIAQEYNGVGEAFPFGFLDDGKNPTHWTRFILLDPDFVRINTHPFVQGSRPYTISMVPNRDLKQIVQKGEGDPQLSKLYKQIPQDIIEAVRAGREITLPNVQVSHVKRTVNVHSPRGESMLSRIVHWLMYRDKLIDGQYATIDRHISPKEFYFIGEPDRPADSLELEAFAEALQSQWTNPNQAVIWHHAVKVQWEGAEGKMLNVARELDYAEKCILYGLGISKALILGEGPGYSAATIAYQAMISRYLTFRKMIEKWMLKSVFEPLCHMHRIYKPTPASLVTRFRIQGRHEPWLPKVIWHKGELSNDMQRAEFLYKLREKGLMSGDSILRSINIDPELENRNMVEEVVRKKTREKEIANATGNALSEPSTKMPGEEEQSMGGFGGGGGTLPNVLPSLTEPTLPIGGTEPGEPGGEGEVAPDFGNLLTDMSPGPGRPPEIPESGPTIPEGERAPL